nr:hypothetical protein [Tanacetum cinerariifolium]
MYLRKVWKCPPHINHCCYECGDPLDGIFCKRCTCKTCGKDAHIGYNCPPTVPVSSNPEPCNNQTIDELPQTLPSFHPTFHSEAESPFTLDSTPTYFDESPNERSDSLDDNIISGLPSFSAITPNEPVLSIEEPDNSLSMGDEHLDTIPVTESNELIKSSVEDLVPIPSESEALKDNSTPSSKFSTKSSSTFPKSVLEETSTFDDSLPEFENFCFDLEEISSGSTTTHSDISFSDYESFSFYDGHIEEISSGSTTTHSDISFSDYESFSFYDGHIEEISSGSTTTHSDISLSEYDSFIFDLSNDHFPPTDMSDFTHEEFADELAHIISPPEYDCFYFRDLPDPGEWISSLNSGIFENLSSTTCVNFPVEDDHSPLLAYVVKERHENDKIGSKQDKNGKRGEAGKSQKQLQ